MIKVEWAMFVEDVDVDDKAGRMDIDGAAVDRLCLDELPESPKVSFASRIVGDITDRGAEFTLSFRMYDAKGEAIVLGWDEVFDTVMEKTLQFSDAAQRHEAFPPGCLYGADFKPTFDTVGVHRLEVSVSGGPAQSVPLLVEFDTDGCRALAAARAARQTS